MIGSSGARPPALAVAALVDALAPIRVVGAEGPLQVSQVTDDSRLVEPGALFVALPGQHTDGARYIDAALARGAVAVATHTDISDMLAARGSACLMQVADAARALSEAAALLYGDPSRQLRVVGVTGTAGKSTTCHMIHQLLTGLGIRAGLISTSGIDTGAGVRASDMHVTTPAAPIMQRLLADIVGHGLAVVVLEASSHGLAAETRRLDDVSFDVGVVTNLSHDHLEFHGTADAYAEAKASLLTRLQGVSKPHLPDLGFATAEALALRQLPRAIIGGSLRNESRFVRAGAEGAGSAVSWFGTGGDCYATDIRVDSGGVTFMMVLDGERAVCRTGLHYRFDVENCLAAALTVARLAGATAPQLATAMASVTTPPGRTVAVDAGQPFKVIVDFAHTPAEFEAVLGGQRTDSGRVIAVFGSAGERDVQKRQLQGQVADRYADVIVLTEEDDRGEEASEITEQIAAGCREKTRGQTLFVEPDRSRAIRLAVGIAAPGDTVFLLGKGHESTIITAGTTRTWSEEASARAALRHRGFG